MVGWNANREATDWKKSPVNLQVCFPVFASKTSIPRGCCKEPTTTCLPLGSNMALKFVSHLPVWLLCRIRTTDFWKSLAFTSNRRTVSSMLVPTTRVPLGSKATLLTEASNSPTLTASLAAFSLRTSHKQSDRSNADVAIMLALHGLTASPETFLSWSACDTAFAVRRSLTITSPLFIPRYSVSFAKSAAMLAIISSSLSVAYTSTNFSAPISIIRATPS
mmetsp:Transcript_74481/g.125468  ORF Transcript_74481/g.125468 Transcript_74481/m.125468 type:complete len:220 (+) Transcript_74481:2204-2863(+)